jgi:hypothetical protein
MSREMLHGVKEWAERAIVPQQNDRAAAEEVRADE